jgi:hypothetical protein
MATQTHSLDVWLARTSEIRSHIGWELRLVVQGGLGDAYRLQPEYRRLRAEQDRAIRAMDIYTRRHYCIAHAIVTRTLNKAGR